MGSRTWAVAAVALGASLACGGGETPPVPEVEADPATPHRPAPRGRALPLDAVLATSGRDAAAAVDGDPGTSWQPVRDPSLEGVLLRFREPVRLGRAEVTGCPEAERVELVLDGVPAAGGPLPLSWSSAEAAPVRAVFVKVALGRKGACLQEITLTDDGGEGLSLQAPRVFRGAVRATSTLEPTASWRPAWLFDGRDHVGWAEGLADDDGLGEKVTVRFEEPRQLIGVEIWNGHQRSPELFGTHNRAKKLRLSADGRGSRELDLADVQGPQLVPIEPPMNGRELVIEIAEIHRGSRSSDTVLSEIRFHDRGGPFALELPDLEEAEQQLRASLAGTPLSRVVGLAFHSRCGADELKLRGDASFVWYGTRTEKKVEVKDVFDGTWAVVSPSGPWPAVSLAGRRSRLGPEAGAGPKAPPGDADLRFATPESLGRDAFVREVEAMAGGAAKDRVACVLEDPEEMERLLKSGALLVKGTAGADLMVRHGPYAEE